MLTHNRARVSGHALERVFSEHGPRGLVAFVEEGLRLGPDKGGFEATQISFRDIGYATGAISQYDAEGSLSQCLQATRSTERFSPQLLVAESHREWERNRENRNAFESAYSNLSTNIFPVVTGQLISSQVIAGYEAGPDQYIGDQLVQVMANQRIRNQRIAGFTSLGGPLEVSEGHPYEETGFAEKYVTTKEAKKGRVLSIPAEMILFDQTGEIMRRANNIGEMTRQERDRTIVRGVVDADSAAGVYIYRPSGVGEALYNSDGSNKNYIGAGNTTNTAYNAAVALTDWTDVDKVRQYRSTAIVDDRIDGSPRPIAGINSGLSLLVPESLRGVANYLVHATEITSSGATTSAFTATRYANPLSGFVGQVLSSPFIDEIGGDALSDWYIGNFRRQFVWTEIWPVQTFTQGADSESAFNNDISMRVKVRYYGGLSATDTIHTTKVDGA